VLEAGWTVVASVIVNVQHDVVHLTLSQRDVAGMGWEQPPRDDDAPEESPDADPYRHV